MVVKVVDASAVAAVLFGEPQAETVVGGLQGYTLAAPVLLPFEVASVCLKKLQRHPAKRALLLNAFRALGQMGIEQVDVNPFEVVLLAEVKRVTVYDAAYLWLAHRLGVELVTLDKKMANAASSAST